MGARVLLVVGVGAACFHEVGVVAHLQVPAGLEMAIELVVVLVGEA